ncbi:hypothetical protein [Micromonospora sp. NPDC049301]|uniref:hypothetical protein n=1 Tax=Micromonospora sp. NPDC049301 TaxID=3155723 RepID=UPI0034285B01
MSGSAGADSLSGHQDTEAKPAPEAPAADGAESLAATLSGVRAGNGSRSASDDVEGDGRAGDEDRTRRQEEFRATRADGLGSLGVRSSAVFITGDGHSFSGQISGGDSVKGGDGGGLVFTLVSRRTVAEIVRVYVRPDGYDEIQRAGEEGSLMLLSVSPRWGGTSTAIRLLADLGQVHELRFSGDLAAVPVESLPEGCGFILDRISVRQLATLRARDLPSLEDRFQKRHSKLVVILDADARTPDHAVERAVHRISTPPSAAQVLTSHLTYLLGSTSEAKSLLTEHGLGDQLATVEPNSFDASQLVELARDLAEAAAGRGTFEEALVRFQDRAQRDVEDWYDEIDGPDQRSIVVALSVLDSMTYDAVTRAAARLEQAWRDDDAGGGALPARARRPRRARLQAARARITNEARNTRYGRAELEIASFLDSSYPERLLRHIWHEHDYDRDLVLAWLNGLASDVEGRVRIRSAMAIGYLSQFAFDTIRRDIITPWARSGDGDERERAVAALSLPARHPDTAGRVIRMVLEWCERTGPLRRTAARALGSSVGAVLATGPDARLSELAEKPDAVLHVCIGDSLAELMADADGDRQIELLRLLDNWSAERAAGRQAAGVTAFLEVAATLWRVVPSPDGDTHWPSLLWMATEGSSDSAIAPARPIIARLWSRALVAPGSDQAVHRVFRRWALSAERSPQLQPHLVRLLLEAATTKRQAGLLAAHARRLRDPEPLAPDLAARLLDVLSQRSHGW